MYEFKNKVQLQEKGGVQKTVFNINYHEKV